LVAADLPPLKLGGGASRGRGGKVIAPPDPTAVGGGNLVIKGQYSVVNPDVDVVSETSTELTSSQRGDTESTDNRGEDQADKKKSRLAWRNNSILGTQLNFNQKPRRAVRREMEKRARGRRKTSTKMAMQQHIMDVSDDEDVASEPLAQAFGLLSIDEASASPRIEHEVAGGRAVRRKSLTASTHFKINDGNEVVVAPKGDDEAAPPRPVKGADGAPKRNELDVSLHSVETNDSVGRASSTASSKSSSKMSISNVMNSISSGFAKAVGRRSSFASSRDMKREKKEREGGGKLSSANLSLHDKIHKNEKKLAHASMEFITDSSIHEDVTVVPSHSEAIKDPSSPIRSERVAWEKLEVKPVRRHNKNFRTSCTFHTRQGSFHDNEDRYLAKLNVYGEPKNKAGTHLFGVFDGHGGFNCAEFVSTHFPSVFVESPPPSQSPRDNKKDIRKALLRALAASTMKMEYNFCQWAIPNRDNSGTCSLLAAVHDNYLGFASVGDCELLMVSQNGMCIERLNHPHRSSGEKERRRIEGAGGFVTRGRAMGVLEPSRTIGDIDVKRMCPGAISAEPEVGIIDLLEIATKEEATTAMANLIGNGTGIELGMFAILATDGVFDVMDHYEVVRNVTRSLRSKKSIRQAAEILCKKAYKMGSDDDISAVVIMFEEVGSSSSREGSGDEEGKDEGSRGALLKGRDQGRSIPDV